MSNGSILILFFLAIGAFIVVVIVARVFTLWYFRIDEHIANQQKMIALLEVISTERTRNVTHSPTITTENTAPTPQPSTPLPYRHPLQK